MPDAKKILIIDDNADYVELLKAILASRGYTVFDAGNGEEGLVELKKNKPDLIILDINMPKMDGMEFYKRIRTRYGRSKYPVLISSAREELKDIFKQEIAVDGFISKPFKIDEMLAQVDRLVKGQGDPLIYVLAMHSNPKVKELEKIFREERYRVEVVEDMNFLKSRLASAAPHALVMEFVQKDKPGEEIIAELKRAPAFQHLPIVVYSHSGFSGLREKALKAGADYFVQDAGSTGDFFHAIGLLSKH